MPRAGEGVAAAIREHLDDIDEMGSQLTDWLTEIAAISSATGHEQERAQVVSAQWSELGADDVGIDEAGNVRGGLASSRLHPAFLVIANLDHVYPPNTDCTPRWEDGILWGPGIYDNAAGLAVISGAIAFLTRAGIALPARLLVAATVGEESGGNLRGMRALMDSTSGQIDAVINIGHDLANVHHEALGAVQMRLEVDGPGGHSYGNYGRPSALHLIVAALDRMLSLDIPTTPRTSLNIGVVQGGLAPNSIAEHASAEIEIRSEDAATQDRVEQGVKDIVADIDTTGGASVNFAILDRRPYGTIPRNHPLVTALAAAHEELGIGVHSERGAADFSEALARGIPAAVNGAAKGGGVKSKDQFLDPASLVLGVKSLALSLGLLMDRWPVGSDGDQVDAHPA